MAGLVIKVSEEKYRDTIEQLGQKINTLKDCLNRLQKERDRVDTEYKGLQADAAILVIKANEKNVKAAIEDVEKKRDNLQNYLDSMIRADSEIKKKYEDAKSQADSVFG